MSNKITPQEVPAGKYDVWAAATPEGDVRFPISADKDSFPQIEIDIAIAMKGQKEGEEVPFAVHTIYQTIDDAAPMRGAASKTPFEYAVDCMMALGAESRAAVIAGFMAGLLGADGVVRIPGVGAAGKKADGVMKWKPARKEGGDPFPDLGIYARRDVPVDARQALAARLAKLTGGAAAPGAAPPAYKPAASTAGNPFVPTARPSQPAAQDTSFPFGANAPVQQEAAS